MLSGEPSGSHGPEHGVQRSVATRHLGASPDGESFAIGKVGCAPGMLLDDSAAERERWVLGAMALHRVVARRARYDRTPDQIRGDLLDHAVFCLATRGSHALRASGFDGAVPLGVPALLSLAEPFQGALHDAEFLCLVVPRDSVADLGPALDRCRPGPLDSVSGRLLGRFLDQLAAELPTMRQAEMPRAVEAIRALLGAALAAGATAEPVDKALVQAARLSRLRGLIHEHLRSPELTAELLCRLSGMSRSQLYRLFEPVGGVAREIQRERLRRVHRAIADPQDRRAIQDIAQEFGFAEPTTFSRAFRREFGYAPGAARPQAPGVR